MKLWNEKQHMFSYTYASFNSDSLSAEKCMLGRYFVADGTTRIKTNYIYIYIAVLLVHK